MTQTRGQAAVEPEIAGIRKRKQSDLLLVCVITGLVSEWVVAGKAHISVTTNT